LKTLLPILESASLEDDEDLHDRWANLLANAAAFDGRVHPSFTQILQGLTGSEAKFLDAIYERIFTRLEEQERSPEKTERDLFRIGIGPELRQLYCHAFGLTEGGEVGLEAPVAPDNFRRLQLVEGPLPGRPRIELTPIGYAFAVAIRTPRADRIRQPLSPLPPPNTPPPQLRQRRNQYSEGAFLDGRNDG
jgi:hypothetical protein